MPTLLILIVAVVAQAGEPDSQAKNPDWMIIARRHAATYIVFRVGDREHPLAMNPEPVLHRAQDVQGSSKGSTFLWKEPSGRPAAICDVFLHPNGAEEYRIGNEWHSLSDLHLQAEWNGQPMLTTSQPGLKWSAVPNPPALADKPASRQREARQIADRFTAQLVARKTNRFELRLLTTPLARYETTDQKSSLGGALFAFCQQTDPEVLLLIEARKAATGYRWEYALAGFSDMDLYVQLDGTDIWNDAPAFSAGRGVHSGGRVRVVNIASELEAAAREAPAAGAR